VYGYRREIGAEFGVQPVTWVLVKV